MAESVHRATNRLDSSDKILNLLSFRTLRVHLCPVDVRECNRKTRLAENGAKTHDPGKVALAYAMLTVAVKYSTSEILKMCLHQSYDHRENHRCRNTEH